MSDTDNSNYDDALESLLASDYSYARKLLKLVEAQPDAPVEDIVLASTMLIHDAEHFLPKDKQNHVKNNPLKAWERYEKSLNAILAEDGKRLNSEHTFSNGKIHVNFLPLQTSSTDVVLVETVSEGPEALIVKPVIEHISDVIEEIDEMEAADNVIPFEYDNVTGNTVYKEADLHTESKTNLSVSKDYHAPEELVVDNSITEEEVTEEIQPEVKAKTIESNKGFSLKAKEYVAPEELIVDNSIHDEHIADITSNNDKDAETIQTVDSTISVDTNLEIHNKDYVAPVEIGVDNSIDYNKIVVNPRIKKVKPKKRFGKKAKAEEYSGVADADSEKTEYVREGNKLGLIDTVNDGSSTAKIKEAEVTPAKVDEKTLAEANEYVVASETDLKLKPKNYQAPEELVIDNSIPIADIDNKAADAIIVETLEHAIESDTEIRIKSKEYKAPEELVIDNSIVEEEVQTEVKQKRGIFGRKNKEETKPSKATPVVFLPPKPIEMDIPEVTEGTEYVYKRKPSISIDDAMLNAAKASNVADEIIPEAATGTVDKEQEDIYKDKLDSNITFTEDINIDYSSLAAEIEKEKRNVEQSTYRPHKVEKTEPEVTDANTDTSERLRNKDDELSKSGFDATAIIKDIKIIDI